MKRSTKIIVGIIAAIIVVAGGAWLVHQSGSAPAKEAQKSSQTKKTPHKKSASQSEKQGKASEQSTSSTASSSASSAEASSAVASVAKAAPQELDQLKENAGGTYSSITATAEGDNTIIYTMTLTDPLDKNTDLSVLKTVLVKALLPAIKQAQKSHPGVVLKVILKNPDGTELINDVISQQEIDQEVQ